MTGETENNMWIERLDKIIFISHNSFNENSIFISNIN